MKKVLVNIIFTVALFMICRLSFNVGYNFDEYKNVFASSEVREKLLEDSIEVVKDEAMSYVIDVRMISNSIASLFAKDNEEAGKGRYYYSTLNESEKKTYEKLYYHASNLNGDFCIIEDCDNHDVFLKFCFDYPEFYWLDGFNTTIRTLNKMFFLNCDISKEEYVSTYNQIIQKADSIVSNVDGLSDYEKVKYIYDYVINNVEYANASHNQDATSALLNGESVCAGYSEMFQLLCNRASIECLSVIGKTNPDRGIYHEWNCVKVDGNYYWVDVTWDDGHKTYKYFLKSDEDFFKTHTLIFDYGYPVCEINY